MSDGKRARVLRPVVRTSSSAAAPHPTTSSQKSPRHVTTVSQVTFAKNAQHLIRKLREVTYRLRDQEDTEDALKVVKEVEKVYNELEVLTTTVNLRADKHLPESSSIYPMASQVPDILQRLNEFTTAMRGEEFLEMSAAGCSESGHKTELLNIVKPIPPILIKTPLAHHNVKEAHDHFLSAMASVLAKERDLRLSRQRVVLHPAGFLSSIIEAEFGKRRESHFVPQLKATVLVQFGHLAGIRLGSTNETLFKSVGELNDSSFHVFRLMGTFATSRLLSSTSTTRLTTHSTILALLIFLQMFTMAFTTPCVSCRRILKDFVPPSRILEVNPSRPVFQHETCAHLPLP